MDLHFHSTSTVYWWLKVLYNTCHTYPFLHTHSHTDMLKQKKMKEKKKAPFTLQTALILDFVYTGQNWPGALVHWVRNSSKITVPVSECSEHPLYGGYFWSLLKFCPIRKNNKSKFNTVKKQTNKKTPIILLHNYNQVINKLFNWKHKSKMLTYKK